jgi:hypothetical protein
MSKKTLFAAPTLGIPPERVDFEKGIIYGAAINKVGPAKGHGVQLDIDFVNDVTRLGNEQGKGGVKVRFGHPTMSGNALLMADEDPDAFGMSIVFSAGELFRVDKDGNKFSEDEPEYRQLTGTPFATIKKLQGADVVDDPAATDGMFSAVQPEAFATQASTFLDENPKLWDLILESPEIVAEFMTRYQAMKSITTKQESIMYDDQTISTDDQPKPETATEMSDPGQTVEVELEGAKAPMEFKALYDKYGAEFAENAFDAGLSESEAAAAYVSFKQDALLARIEELEAKLSATTTEGEEAPVDFSAEDEALTAEQSAIAEKKKQYKGRTSDGIANFAAQIKLPKE